MSACSLSKNNLSLAIRKILLIPSIANAAKSEKSLHFSHPSLLQPCKLKYMKHPQDKQIVESKYGALNSLCEN